MNRNHLRNTLGGGGSSKTLNSQIAGVDSKNQNTKVASNTSARQKSQEISKQSKVFRPLIASSLALALSASSMSAFTPDEILAKPCGTGNPAFCVSDGATMSDDQSSHLGLKLDTAVSNLITPQYTPSGSQSPITIENLNIAFDRSGTTDFKGEADGATNTTYNITLGTKAITEALLKGNGKGIQMGANGNGTLKVDLTQTDDRKSRSFVLDLSQIDSGTTAFKGNLTIANGRRVTPSPSYDPSRFKAVFGGDMIGNLTFASELVYDKNPTKDTADVIFKNGNLTGDLTVGNLMKVDVTFENTQETKINGKVNMSNGELAIKANSLTVAKGLSIRGSKLTLDLSGNNVIGADGEISIQNKAIDMTINLADQATLNIEKNLEIEHDGKKIFKILGSKADLTIGGNIALQNSRKGHIGSELTFDVKSLNLTGNLTSANISTTAITLNGGDSKITGGVTTSYDSSTAITLNGGTLGIDGQVKVENAGNKSSLTLTANSKSHLTLVQELLAGGGNSSIKLVANDSKMTVASSTAQDSAITLEAKNNSTLLWNGDMVAKGGTTSSNRLTLEDSSLTIGGELSVRGNGNSTNVNTITATNSNITIGGIRVQPNGASKYSNNDKNILNITGGSLEIQKGISLIAGTEANSESAASVSISLTDATSTIGGDMTITNGGSINFTLNSTDAFKPTTLTLNGATNQISTLKVTGTNNALNLADTAKTTSINTLNLDGSHLNINNSNTTADSLTIANLNLSNSGNFVVNTTPKLTNLNVTGTGNVIEGNITAGKLAFADSNSEIGYSGNLTITNIDANSGEGTFTATEGGGASNYLTINGGSGTYTFQATKMDKEAEIIEVAKTIEGITLTNGKYDDGDKEIKAEISGVLDEATRMTTWRARLNEGVSSSRTQSSQDISASFLNVYLANFNSLNKRMGELRENKNGQGAWGRIFNGQENNKFSNSSTNFTTIQAGYDYAFGLGEGVTNYLGAALSYGFGSSGFDNNQTYNRSLGNTPDMTSHLVEFAIYNSYVQDEGWFNDTIIKFGSLMNNISSTGLDVKTNSFAFTFSDEVGYRFKLGSEKEWFIDPQVELGMGHVADAKFNNGNYQVTADSMFVLRTRLGASAGYDFKKLLNGDNIKASAYVGIFAEIDSFNGGNLALASTNAKVLSRNANTQFKSTDARGVINYGGNVAVKDNIRVYLDMEHSFGGQISTDYKINAGVRYSFGEKAQFLDTKAQEKKDEAKKKEETPLKLKEEEKKNAQEQAKDVKKETKAQEKQTTSETSKNEKAEAKKTESKKADAKAEKKPAKKQATKKQTTKKQPAKKQAQAKKPVN